VVRVKVPAAPGGRYVGLVLLFSTETGEPLAIIPDGVVQRMRVGATNGLAAKYLARRDATTVGLIGSGWQAGGQLMAIAAVRAVERVRCFSPNPERRAAFCRDMTARLGVEVEAVGSAEAAVRDVDVAMCGTSRIEPIFSADWVRPGMHLSSIKRPELEPAAIRRADRFVIHSRDPSPLRVTTRGLAHPEGDTHGTPALAGEFDFDTLPVLPDLVSGKVPGRQSDDEVTCFVNNLGMGYQFAVVGALVLGEARKHGVGRDLPTEWFTEAEHP
jgi:ornithine cyclodeaminase/alanine dehydrogenase-like protein (mu-crystallin family)